MKLFQELLHDPAAVLGPCPDSPGFGFRRPTSHNRARQAPQLVGLDSWRLVGGHESRDIGGPRVDARP